MRWTVFVAATVVVVVPWTAARAEARSLRIEYRAPASCPDEHRFVELTRDRVREWPALEERSQLVARIVTEENDGAFTGRLSLEDTAGASLGQRTIQETSCEDVVLALALFLAVALEADAAENATRPQPSASVETPPAPSSPAPLVDKAPPPSRPAPERGPLLRWYVLARVHGVAGRMPDLGPGAALGVDLGSRESSPIRPFGGLGVDLAPYSTRHEGRGQVDVGWGAVFGRACLGLEPTQHGLFEPWVCLRAEAGTLRASSHGYAINRKASLPWYAAGGEAGLAVRVTQAVSVGAFIQAVAPFVRHDLVLHEALLFRSPWISGEGGLELKLRIW